MLASIFYQFFLLGCTSFGGPIAHLGYFQRHFVEHKKWLSQARYGQLIALSQLLPGPSSSQVGFAIGLEKAGLLGGIAAFIGFTLPSFLIMLTLAMTVDKLGEGYLVLVNGLKLFAVVVVADALLGMAKSFCRTTALRIVAFVSTLILLVLPGMVGQLGVLLLAMTAGLLYRFSPLTQSSPVQTADKAVAQLPLLIFFLLFVPLFLSMPALADLFGRFYQAGALVFGGGHVVLPMLQANIPELSTEQFLTGYASAQAIPGPMFTLATYLGAELTPQSPWLGAAIATLAVFTPGFLLVMAFHSGWQSLLSRPRFASCSAAINAAVVGFLAAALYTPIWPSAVHSLWDLAVVILGFVWLQMAKPKIWLLMLIFVGYAVIRALPL